MDLILEIASKKKVEVLALRLVYWISCPESMSAKKKAAVAKDLRC